MSSKSIGRVAASARTLRVWSTATLATLVLAACGGGGGGGDSSPPPQNPPPQNQPPSTPTNAAPVPSAGADQAFDLPTDTATLSGTATDDGQPAGSTISYTWEFVSGPLGPNSSPGVVFANANAQNTTARFAGGVGDYTLNLKASDGALTGTATLRVAVRANPNTYPAAGAGSTGWSTVTPADEQMDSARLDEARDYSIASALGTPESGFIVRHGRLVYSWGDTAKRYEMKSTTKSMGGLALLLALDEGKLALTDKASDRLTGFGTSPPVDTSPVTTGGLGDITLLQLATHTAGFNKSDDTRLEPRQLLFTPGTTWSYSDQGLNWLADVLTQSYAQDLDVLLNQRVFNILAAPNSEIEWRIQSQFFRGQFLNVNGSDVTRRELASGLNASVNAMARVGLLMLRKGVWGNNLVLSNAVVERAHTPPAEIAGAEIAEPTDFPQATANYGVLWWTNANHQMPDVPTDAYWAWGLHDTLIIVVPSLDLVIARAGDRGWRTQNEFWNADYTALEPFLTPIVQSVTP
jgi:CubicO group peptidase (beta-lactamase class C family)